MDAYKKADIPPETIRYIELHGTGTQLGDPVKVDALKDALKKLEQFLEQRQKQTISVEVEA